MEHRTRWWIAWVIGPALTVLVTFGYDWLRRYAGAPDSVMVLIPLVVLAGFMNGSPLHPNAGLWAGLVSAAWVAAYSLYLGPSISFERIVLVPIGVLVIAIMVGFLRKWAWEGERLQQEAGELALGANIARLESLENLARELEQNWDRMEETERKERVRVIWDRANNIGTLAHGWRQVGRHQYWARYGHKVED